MTLEKQIKYGMEIEVVPTENGNTFKLLSMTEPVETIVSSDESDEARNI